MIYQHGIDRCVYYPKTLSPESLIGVTDISEEPAGGTRKKIYLDGEGFRSSYTYSDFEATISLYTFPESIETSTFDLTYRRMLNSEDYELHLVYNCKATLNDRSWTTETYDASEPVLFSFSLTTLPPKNPVPYFNRSPHLIIRSSDITDEHLSHLEDILYGTDSQPPRMPTQDELEDFMESWAILRITDHGDGTWTAEGPDTVVGSISNIEFFIDWPSATMKDLESYQVYSK